MHPGQKLIDHLEGRARARLLAQLVDLGRDAIERRADARKGRGRPRAHDRQFTAGRTHGAAADRRVEILHADLGAALGEDARQIGRHRGAGHHDAAFGHGRNGAARSEKHLLCLVGIDDHGDHQIRILRTRRRVSRNRAAKGGEALHRIGIHIDARHREPVSQQALGHAEAHRSQTDDTDLRLLG